MANHNNFINLLAMASFVVLILNPLARAEIQCSTALSQLLPCEIYLFGWSANPSPSCCIAVQSLGNLAMQSAVDRKSMCLCFKQAATHMPINLPKAKVLPDLCHVNLGSIQIDPNVNCDRI